MTDKEIAKHRKYKEKLEEIEGSIGASNFIGSILIVVIFITVQLLEYGLIIQIVCISSLILWILLFFRSIKYYVNKENLKSKNRLLDLKMKGYEKQLKNSGLNINLNKRENNELNVDYDRGSLEKKLEELNELKVKGVLTEEEYKLKRKQIIERY